MIYTHAWSRPDLRRGGKAEQNAQRCAQVIVGGVTLTPQFQPKTLNRLLRRSAAKRAGERRSNVGCGYDLLGRFFRRHLFAGRRC